ncbi:hypothetical protein CVV38_02780 [Candidatus Peregrinibacteria bacterium HGW-Peregrinibacteria-1]|jgi:thymidylate kinase|nr:MAG: hypothetical protein CVV38_02780 [Candidatus Peregrinibacteria bacterium HGW-Peregrinibacteria-1]
MNKGVLIAIYGINNIGKTTHAQRLVKNLRAAGYQAEYVKYPVYDLVPTGPFINEVLRGGAAQKISEEELQMWYVLNRYQNEKQVNEWIDNGVIVVAEDYSGTGIAWGTAKGADQDWLISINKYLRKEDFTIFMRGQRALSAKEEVHVHEQNDDLIERCRVVHEKLAEEWNWKPVELQALKEDTEKLVWQVTKEFLSERGI